MMNRPEWTKAMADGRHSARMARYAMPREVRPLFASCARAAFSRARSRRLFGI